MVGPGTSSSYLLHLRLITSSPTFGRQAGFSSSILDLRSMKPAWREDESKMNEDEDSVPVPPQTNLTVDQQV